MYIITMHAYVDSTIIVAKYVEGTGSGHSLIPKCYVKVICSVMFYHWLINVMQGDFVNNEYNGTGTYFFPDGSCFTGTFTDNR